MTRDFSDALVEAFVEETPEIVIEETQTEELDESTELQEVAFSDLFKAVSDPSVKVGDTVTWKSNNSPYGTCGKVIKIDGERITVSQGKNCTTQIIVKPCNCHR